MSNLVTVVSNPSNICFLSDAPMVVFLLSVCNISYENEDQKEDQYFIKFDRNSESKYLPPELCTQILAKSPAKTVVRFRCVCKSWCDIEQDGGSMSVAVYTLSDQQWSLRNDGLNMSFSYYVRLFWQNCSPKTGFIFQGAAHWISDDPNGDGNPADSSTHLVSLDFDLEKFTYLELPFASDDIGAVRFPFRLRESLAVFCISSEKFSIWELKEDTEKRVWTSRFSGLSSGDGFSLFSATPRLPLFFYESDDGGWFVYGKKSYNIASCQVHELGNKSVSRYVDMQMYREGLVLCKGYEAEDLESCS